MAEDARRLSDLVESMRARYEQTGDEATLDGAIRAADEAAAALPQDDPVRVDMLQQAGVLRRYRFERSGAPDDIAESVRLLREATGRSGGDADKQHSLVAALQRQFAWTGATGLLDEAIEGERRIVDVTPVDHPDRGPRLNNLATALRYRYLHAGDLAALRESLALLREAGDRREYVATLGVTLQDLFWRTGDARYADEAVTAARDVLAGTAVRRTMAVHTFANALRCRFAARGRVEDLHEAIGLLDEVMRQTDFGTAEHALCLGNLANAWMQEYRRSGDPAALGRSTTALGRVVRADAVPEQERARYQAEWAEALLIQFDHLGDPGILRRAEAAFAAAASNEGASPMLRLLAASDWGRLAARRGDWPAALSGARLAIEMIPYVTSRALARADREYGLTRLSGVAAEAAACALRADDPVLALRWLEQGRGVLMRQALEARTDLPAVPGIAREWAEIHDALDIGDLPSERRHALAARRSDLLTTIRSHPGFAHFLEPPTLDALRADAAGGPVVLINLSEQRCDALVLTTDGVRVIPLADLSLAAAQRQAERFAAAVAAASMPGAGEAAAQGTLTEILGWLWDTVTGPVLDDLGSPPRVWWSPGGALTALPLHAAGHPGGPNVLDRTISSYTPIVQVLGRARTAVPKKPGDLLIVAMPETDGEPPLPGARREAAEVSALWPAEVLLTADATRAAVLAALSYHDCVHFACHAVSDPATPSASRLLVHDHRDRALTLLDISRMHLPTAQLAVLSACHTARGPRELADEALHITAAFQLAGYRSVVGTLWQVNDRVASRLAVDFHHRLRADPGRSALSLHEAVRQLRDTYPATPSLWAAHVHYGS